MNSAVGYKLYTIAYNIYYILYTIQHILYIIIISYPKTLIIAYRFYSGCINIGTRPDTQKALWGYVMLCYVMH